jgi:peptidase E
MTTPRGTIAIMGSGETTDSMVRVHRHLLERLKPPVRAVFIDTPAGFQMNADDLFDKAREYFQKRLNQPLQRVSFRSAGKVSPYEAEKAYQTLRAADYIFVGPGSPTYALKNWAGTPIPQIIQERIREGSLFVAASAAALTLGAFTLPVYEIYKVGEDVHWVEGLNLLGSFGLPFVVIPHWNNAEGGTHDTRFCYMGEPRLIQLERLLPSGTPILGIDEHTACILDFSAGQVLIRGVGGVTLRRGGGQTVFQDGETLSLAELKKMALPGLQEEPSGSLEIQTTEPVTEPFLERVKSLQEAFGRDLQENRADALIHTLVTLDKLIWKSSREFEDEEGISRARETLRGMIVQLGLRFDELPKDIPSTLAPLMAILMEIREKLRSSRFWELADMIRDKLLQEGIIVEDTPDGPRWHLKGAPAGAGSKTVRQRRT